MWLEPNLLAKRGCGAVPDDLIPQHTGRRRMVKNEHQGHACLDPPSPLRKHQEIQEKDGQTGSWCLDKAVLARDAWYQTRSDDISRD